ncbi:hypothetical protein HN51_059974 [Arachis hypogaea]
MNPPHSPSSHHLPFSQTRYDQRLHDLAGAIAAANPYQAYPSFQLSVPFPTTIATTLVPIPSHYRLFYAPKCRRLSPPATTQRHRHPLNKAKNSFVMNQVPFSCLPRINDDDFKETAYELFFTACKSLPGFGGQSILMFYSKHENNNDATGAGGAPVSQSSRMKRVLGLKMIKSTLDQRILAAESPTVLPLMSPLVSLLVWPMVGGSSPKSRLVKLRKQMSMADVMRVQMHTMLVHCLHMLFIDFLFFFSVDFDHICKGGESGDEKAGGESGIRKRGHRISESKKNAKDIFWNLKKY